MSTNKQKDLLNISSNSRASASKPLILIIEEDDWEIICRDRHCQKNYFNKKEKGERKKNHQFFNYLLLNNNYLNSCSSY